MHPGRSARSHLRSMAATHNIKASRVSDDPRAQVISAAGAGSAAAIALNAELVEDDIRNATRDFNRSVLSKSTTHAKESP